MTDVEHPRFELSDRFGATDGRVALSGVQALIRVPLDQRRADHQRGLEVAGLISGYRGSPLGGVDQAYEQNREVLEANHIRFVNGVNEDLAATMVWGAQLSALESDPLYDGVVGLWYGKGPGVDRSGDAFRHGNFSGVHPTGGVLVAAGDDPACKSSTIPSASEWALADAAMPVLYPADVQDVLDLGRVAYELSRFCGSWVGFKIHTDVADAYDTVDLSTNRLSIVAAKHLVGGHPWRPRQDNRLLAPFSLDIEEEVFTTRLDAARTFVAAQGIDRRVGVLGRAPVGIVAAGKSYGDVRDALAALGLATDGHLADAGVALVRPSLIWPLEPGWVHRLGADVDEIIVVEEKRAFIETQIRDLLYGRADAPAVVGKIDPAGAPLVPVRGALDADQLTPLLRRRLSEHLEPAHLTPERARLALIEPSDLPNRSPYYCSGCPHNRSTVVPEGSVAAGGIGCHSMALFMDRDTVGLCQMGGEGAQWSGTAPFVGSQHRFQNLGDGTLFHSGSLAIRQAVAAGADITYKILYNGVVAMTGGQEAAGEMPVPELTRWLEAEGVVTTVVVSDDVDKYPADAAWGANTRLEERDRLDDVQRELREVSGVTALVYDQGCAAELRRSRKRGDVAVPTTRVMIDELICDGCGHCGQVSNCVSVHPIDTPFGRKTQIHQESCNFDLTCLGGNCPAFVTVEVDPAAASPRRAGSGAPDGPLPAEPAVPDQANIVLVGVGGTGVVTVNQVLATAAMLDGRHAGGLDQTGLSQKGGPVVSNLTVGIHAAPGSNRVGAGEADVYLVFDVVAGTSPANLARLRADHTVAIVSSALLPTGAMVAGTAAETFPDLADFQQAIDARTRSADNVWLNADGIARAVFGSQPAANLLLVGVAHQRGLLPVTADAIEQAIELNGVAVEMNLAAFRLGRRLAVEPDLVDHLVAAPTAVSPPPAVGPAAALLSSFGVLELPSDLADVLGWRVPELVDYQDEALARRYLAVVAEVRRAEQSIDPTLSLAGVVARQLFKLMAYKDEYEVARLALKSDVADRARERFGPGAKVSYQLKPPTMKRVGVDRKVAIAERAGRAMFAGLMRTKRLRGTRLDPFGRTEERRVERALIDEYVALAERLAAELTAVNHSSAVEIAGLADQIRGFDDVKLANVARYRTALASALTTWPTPT